MATFTGTDNGDSINGSNSNDDIYGGSASAGQGPGNDTLNGLGGNDTIYGGDGNDNLFGGNNNDSLTGGAGNDSVSGGANDDTIEGGAGADTMDGGAGNDVLSYANSSAGVTVNIEVNTASGGDAEGDAISNFDQLIGSGFNDVLTGSNPVTVFGFLFGGDDTITGGDGNDTIDGAGAGDDLFGGNGDDQVAGGTGSDLMDGGQGADVLDGGADDDTITGAEGDDQIAGGSGDDNLSGGTGADLLEGSDGADIITGGGGSDDTVSYEGSDAGVNIDLDLGTASGGHADGDFISTVENVTGSGFDDTLGGNDVANRLNGLAGNDNLNGAGGNDTIDGGDGNDTVDGGDGTDTYVLTGDWEDYTITRSGDTYTITVNGFTDTVTGVENFDFNGNVVSVTEDPDTIVTLAPPVIGSVLESGTDEDEDDGTIEVDENSADDTEVAEVTASDPNLVINEELTFELVDDEGDAYTGPFTITKTGDTTASITVSGPLDHEDQASQTLYVKVTDSDGNEVTQEVTVTVLDVNEAPTDIAFDDDAPAIDENAEGAVITTLEGTDPDDGDTLTYSVDDERFEIVEEEGVQTLKLKDGETLDHEDAEEVTVEITITDEDGETYSEELTITVGDVNEAPTDITFGDDAPAIDENGEGTVITTLEGTDPDDGDTLTFTVDDERFEIVEEEGVQTLKLKDGESLDHEAEDEVTVTVTATDADGLTYDEGITITVNDLNEAPTDITFGSDTPEIDEEQEAAIITTVAGVDEDADEVLTYSVDDERFEVTELTPGTFVLKLKDGEAFDFETETEVSVEVTVTDEDGESFTKSLTIDVNAVNEAPGGGAALDVWTPDAMETGRRRAQLFPEAEIEDPEGDTLTYTLATGPSAGTLFLGNTAVAVGQTLTEAEFQALTYKTPEEGNYGATFTVSDGENDVALNVVLNVSGPVNDSIAGTAAGEELEGGAGNDTVRGGSGDDSLYGGSDEDVVGGGDGSDMISGNGGDDVLFGRLGDDTVSGGVRADLLAGGDGNDLLYGGKGQDTIRGGDGADTIYGDEGSDKLFGGKGADDFVFDTAPGDSNADRIGDFQSGVDDIVLAGSVFDALGKSVSASEFRLGIEAQDANDHLIYDRASGKLYYDANGAGNGGQKLIAQLDPGTSLSHTNFDVI